MAIKVEGGNIFAIGGVRAAEPVKEVKEFLNKMEGIFFRDAGGVVDGDVAHLVDSANFGEESWFKVVLEGLLVNEGSEAIVVGELKVGVIGIEPVNSLL